MQNTQISTDIIAQKCDAFVQRMLQSTAGVYDIFTIYIGGKLGFYPALRDGGTLTSTELADRTGTHERYVREWLEQQTVTGILEVDDEMADLSACGSPAQAGAKRRKFRIPPGHDEVLVERDSLNYLVPFAQIVVGFVHPLTSIIEAYRNGGGVPFSDYGVDAREGVAGTNRAMFLRKLGTDWIPTMSDVHARLQAGGRVADIGCGAGWVCISMAQSYPNVNVDGFDIDAPSIELAQANAIEAGLNSRVRFHVRDAADPEFAGHYDLVTAFMCVHDMSNPVGALRTMRRLAGDNGTVLIVDPRVGETFTAKGNDDVERLYYGASVLHCLPVGMADQPSAGMGTVMRHDTLRRYAAEAGFREVEILPIENFFFRFYRLNL